MTAGNVRSTRSNERFTTKDELKFRTHGVEHSAICIRIMSMTRDEAMIIVGLISARGPAMAPDG
jgi:hypothetical protein